MLERATTRPADRVLNARGLWKTDPRGSRDCVRSAQTRAGSVRSLPPRGNPHPPSAGIDANAQGFFPHHQLHRERQQPQAISPTTCDAGPTHPSVTAVKATALLDIQPRLRRVKGHKHLPMLRQAIQAELVPCPRLCLSTEIGPDPLHRFHKIVNIETSTNNN